MQYTVVLVQKVKKLTTADTAAGAVEAAMKEVEEGAELFTPTQWTVKENVE